ncbi:hypothetical protein GCM10025863_16120 [Microbacterium suwonense]|uniref:Glyceraldehyde-3-phosphate dehydrogenase n=1 Tax=Microbacterium suwonense TaxID=683047 RepID=A0ABN6X2H1_9MICO|nr:hypothetical protein GCM10025863_16120 [Microbacterium suwonense]
MEHVVTHHDDWQINEELAERMIPLIGGLNRERDVVTSLHGHRLLGLSTTGILEVHERVAQLGHRHLALTDTLAVLEALHEIGPGASSLDVARLVEGHAASGKDLTAYLRDEIAPALGAELSEPVDIVLYGFGRIGRLLARIIIAHKGVAADCGCERSSCAAVLRTTSSNAPRCCCATPCTVASRARSTWTSRTHRSSPTASASR